MYKRRGHKMAAGMTIMEDKIDDFKQFVTGLYKRFKHKYNQNNKH